MHQNYICQNRLHSINLIKILKNYYINQFNQANVARFSISANTNKFNNVPKKFQTISLRKFSEKTPLKPLDANRNFATTKSEADSEKDLIVENFSKDKEISNLTKNLSIWSAAGMSAFVGSFLIGDISYGIAALPLLILHYEVVMDCLNVCTRNMIIIQRYIRARITDAKFAANDMNLAECFDYLAQKRSNDTMMHFESTKWTYKQAEMLTNKITNYFLTLNYEKGDVVAIMVTNRPEYITLVIGLARIGIVAALIDTNLKGDSLLNSIYLSDCRGMIISEDIIQEVHQIQNKVSKKIELFQLGGKNTYENFTNLSNALIDAPFQTPEIIHKVTQKDPLLYIYANTGTKIPKYTKLSHSKFISQSVGITHLLNLQIDDVLYNPLPLCNSSGIVMGSGPTIICGIPSVICRKFSPNKYWSDCIKYKCTVGQYVDDVCQYLLAEPAGENEKYHSIRKIIGNKVNPVTWKKFLLRFNPISGDSNQNIINIGAQEPRTGFLSSLLSQYMYPIAMNGSDSQVAESTDGEESQFISITTLNPPMKSEPKSISKTTSQENVTNYFSTEPNKDTIIQNEAENSISNLNYYKTFQAPTKAHLFAERKEILNQQKTVMKDKMIQLHLLGRTEDAYTWKGKTIITKEVESIIKIILGLSHCLVYGVQVPGVDGKIGMVSIVDLEDNINMPMFSQQTLKYIPYYACPVIVRLVNQCHDLTDFDKRKLIYAIEGFDPANLKDKIYYLNKTVGFFEPLTADIYQKIIRNKILF